MILQTNNSPSLKITSGFNNPEGANIGNVGDLYLRNNNGAGELWQKATGGNNLAGWAKIGGGSGTVTNALNGLSLNETTAYLGGTLLQNTVVNQNGFDLTFANGNLSIINGNIPTLGGVGAALQYSDATDYYASVASSGSAQLLWLDIAGGVRNGTLSVSNLETNAGRQVSATQRNQWFANDNSTELEMGDSTFGSTVSLALMSLQNPLPGQYQGEFLVRSSYTSDQDYNTTGIDLNQASMDVYILEPTVSGVVGISANNVRLTATGAFFGAATNPTARVHIAAGTASASQINLTPGLAPSSPNDGDFYYVNTNDRFMFRKNTTDAEIISASAVTTEVLIGDTALTITYNGTTYKLLAKA